MSSTFEKMTKSARPFWESDKQVIVILRLREDKTVGRGIEKDRTQESKHNSKKAETRKLFQPETVR